jgi:hypothetical protein
MRTLALLLTLLLAACVPAAETPRPTLPPATADSPTSAPIASPTTTDEPALVTTAAVATAEPIAAPGVGPTDTEPPTAAATPNGPVAGRNDDGTFFFGAADAPVTLTDYSDFL